VLSLISIDNRIRVIDPQEPSQGFDFIVVAREMIPTSPWLSEKLTVSCQDLRRIDIGIDADGQKEHVFSHAVLEMLVNLHEVLGNSRSYPSADRIKELDHHNPVSDQIAVKAVFLAFMVHQNDIREFIRVFPTWVSMWTSPCTLVYIDRLRRSTTQRRQEAYHER
jgi:hypothetical protein